MDHANLSGKENGKHTVETARTLVVLDSETPGATLGAALRRPAVATADLDLLVVYSDAAYDRQREGIAASGFRGPFSVEQFGETAARAAARAGREWLGAEGTSFRAYGDVGRVADCVSAAVDDRGYTRVCLPRDRRSLLARLLGSPSADELAALLPAGVELVRIDDQQRLDEPVDPVIESDATPVDE